MNSSEIILKGKWNASDFQIEHFDHIFTGGLSVEEIVAGWDEVKALSSAQGQEIWDGTCYRLNNLADLKAGIKKLQLSSIRYSTVRALIQRSKVRPIGVDQFPLHVNTGALIRTRESLYLFGVKGKSNEKKVELVGGGLQSSELLVNDGNGLARNMLKEIEEEINVSPAQISRIKIIGIVFSAKTMGIVIVFDVILGISHLQVHQQFLNRTDLELAELLSVKAPELRCFLAGQNDYVPVLGQLLDEERD